VDGIGLLCRGLLRHKLANRGSWSTQAKVLKATLQWGSDSSVVSHLLGELGRTPLHVGLPSAWGSVDGDRIFSTCFLGQLSSLNGDS